MSEGVTRKKTRSRISRFSTWLLGSKGKRIRVCITRLLTFLLALAVFASLFYIASKFFLPSPKEYDDPTTKDVDENFPWDPLFHEDPDRAMYLFGMGLLRHIAVLPDHVGTLELIAMVGRVFFVLFIYRIRKTFANPKIKLDIGVYLEWGIGSIIGAVIYVAGTIATKRETDVALACLLLALGGLVLYSIYSLHKKTKEN